MAFLNSQLHVNQALTDYAISFRPELEDYLWNTALPKKVVSHKSDVIRSIDKGQILRLWDIRTGGQAKPSQRVSFKIGANQLYECVSYRAEAILDPVERANADSVLLYDQEQMFAALMAMQTNFEFACVKDTLRNPAILTNNVAITAANRWDNYASPTSDPITDLTSAIELMRVRIGGKNPNFLAMHRLVWNQVQKHPAVLARGAVHVNPAGLGIVTPTQFEQILDLPPGSLHITVAQYNTAVEGTPDDFRSFIGPDVIIGYNEPTPGVRNYGLGQSFMFLPKDLPLEGGAKLTSGSVDPMIVIEYPGYGIGEMGVSTIASVYGSVAFKVLVPDAGYLLTDVVNKTNTALYGNLLNN